MRHSPRRSRFHAVSANLGLHAFELSGKERYSQPVSGEVMTETMGRSTALLRVAAAVATMLFIAPVVRAQKLDAAMNEQAGANKDAAASQARIDQLADQTQDMLSKYRQAVNDAEALKKYNEQ